MNLELKRDGFRASRGCLLLVLTLRWRPRCRMLTSLARRISVAAYGLAAVLAAVVGFHDKLPVL